MTVAEASRGSHWKKYPMLFALAAILVVAWLLGFSVFHVAGSLIHLLLVLAVIVVVWHFIGGRRTSA
jgi:hypothetical protein